MGEPGVIHVQSQGGNDLYFTLPLPYGIQKQIDAGQLRITQQPDTSSTVTVREAPQQVAQRWETPLEVPVPRKNAGHAEWIEYAVSQGMERTEAVALRRNELVARLVLDDVPEQED